MRLLLAILLILLTADAFGASYYVTTTGSGSVCTQGTPCADPQTALNLATTPGDTVYLGEGTYTLGASGLFFAADGTSGNPITLTTSGNALSARIDCVNTNADEECVGTTRSYVVIENLEVYNAQVNGIKIDGDYRGTTSARDYGDNGAENYHPNGADNVIIRNNYIYNAMYDGIKINHGNGHLIENNEIYRSGRCNHTSPETYPSSCTQQGIDAVGIYDTTFSGNTIHDDPADYHMHIGLFIKGGSENIIIENNYIYDIGTYDPIAIEVGGDTESYNTRYTASNFVMDFTGTPCEGYGDINECMLATDGGALENASIYSNQYAAEARNNIVRGNLIRNVGIGVSFRNAYNTKVYGNTMVDTGKEVAGNIDGTPITRGGYFWKWENDLVDLHISAEDTLIYNNLTYSSGDLISKYYEKSIYGPNTGLLSDYNLSYNDGTAMDVFTDDFPVVTVDANGTEADPALDGSYRPGVASPARSGGVNLRTVGVLGAEETWTDRDGTTRSTETDIGALLYDAGDVTAPSTTISTSDPVASSTGSATVEGTASDAVGVSGCKWRLSSAPDADNGTACTGTTSFSCAVTGLASGANTVYVGCYDAAGNYGSDSITANYTPPTATVTGVTFTGVSWQ